MSKIMDPSSSITPQPPREHSERADVMVAGLGSDAAATQLGNGSHDFRERHLGNPPGLGQLENLFNPASAHPRIILADRLPFQRGPELGQVSRQRLPLVVGVPFLAWVE